MLGPGLLESAYEECLCHELHIRCIAFRRQVELPIEDKGLQLSRGYRLDVVEGLLINFNVDLLKKGIVRKVL